MRRSSSRDRGPGAEGAVDLQVLRRVAPYLWPSGEGALEVKARVVGAMALLVVAKIATVVTPYFFKQAVDVLSGGADPSGLAGFAAMGAVALTLGYGLARLGGNAFQQLRDAVFAKVTQQALRRLAGKTFAHIHALSLRFHLERRTGALSRVIDRGVKAIEFVLRFLLFSIVPLLLELLLVAGILYFAFDARFLAIVLTTMLAYIAFTVLITEWRVKIRRIMNESDQEATQKAIDSLLNYETVKYFNAETRETQRYDTAMRAYEAAAIKTQVTLGLLNFGQAMIVTAGLVAMMVLAAYGVQAGDYTVGDFVMVNAYMIQIMLPLGFLGTVYREIRQAVIDMAEMFTLLDRDVEVRDAAGAPALALGPGRVAFDHVRFAYGPDRVILEDVSFAVEGGKMLAIVGASGAGKSTIARLLYRFYDVTGGAVRVDGQDVRSVTQTSLRASIAVVPQDTVLFNDTIGYNLGYARDDVSREEIIAAAKAARLDGFIDRLEFGYDTVVGERGLKLSGGEKQRVGIARAILKSPRILILDEATSALDSRTEMEIQEQLRAVGAGRTVIAIAHRLSTVVDADEIIVLERGRVAERGPHAALLAADGLYAEMWRRQSADYQPLAPAEA